MKSKVIKYISNKMNTIRFMVPILMIRTAIMLLLLNLALNNSIISNNFNEFVLKEVQGKTQKAKSILLDKSKNIKYVAMEEVKGKYPQNSFFNMGMDIADVYDALKSKRSYKPYFCHEKCCNIIYEESGIYFDPDIVEAFRDINFEFFTNWESLKD